MKVKIYNSFTEELKKNWQELEKSSENYVFQTYTWSKYWFDTICLNSKNISLNIILICDDDFNPQLIVPLCVKKKFGIKILTFLGGRQSDYQTIIADSTLLNDINKFQKYYNCAKSVFPNSDIMHFEKVPEVIGNSRNILLDILKFNYQESTFSVKLPPTYDDFKVKIKAKTLSDIKRQVRRLNSLGEVELDCELKKEYEIEDIREMIKQKRARYSATNVPDMFRDDRICKFYLNLNKSPSDDFHIHFSTLKLNDKIIATHWGIVYLNRFYFLMPTYLMGEYSVFSPGKILLNELINWSIKNKLNVFDFTIGSESYKKEWCDTEFFLFEHFTINSFKGYVYLLLIKAKRLSKRNSHVLKFAKFCISLHRKLF